MSHYLDENVYPSVHSHPVNSVYTQSVTIRQQVWVPLRIVLEALRDVLVTCRELVVA